MAVPLTSFLSKASPAIPFLLKDTDLRGGYRVVSTEADRDAIPTGAKAPGMLVFVTENSTFFQWDGAAFQPLDVTSMVNTGTGLTMEADAITVDTAHLDTLYAPVTHDHDAKYADINHDHDTQYSALTHDHDGDYAPATHDHDAKYADINHDHDTQYADINHDHDGDYAPVVHTHDTQYADINHDHDSQYAALTHSHAFASLTEVPKVTAMPGVTISTSEPAPTDGEDGDLWFVIAP